MNTADITDMYPLSPQQQGMLFATAHSAQPGAFVEQESHSLPRGLDPTTFRMAWERILDRHDVLRTAFVWRDQPQPLQILFRHVDLPLRKEDWRGRSRAEVTERLEALMDDERRRGFDLARAPLMRLALVRTDEGHEFVWTLHHIVMDGWSRPLLVKELTALYAALSTGTEAELGTDRPYRDYIVWLRRQNLAAAESFWASTLAGFTGPTPLGRPDDLPTAVAAAADGFVEDRIDASGTAALRAFARRQRLTLSSIIHGAWALLLSRYSGRRDVVFGTTVSGRSPDLDGSGTMIGLFIQTLPFRVDVDPRAALGPWLATVQRRHLDARRFEHCSAGQIHAWSAVPAARPLYESLLVVENYPTEARPESSSQQPGRSRFSGARTAHPLTVLVGEADDLLIRVVHDRRRIDDRSAALVLGGLRELILAVAAGPDTLLAELAARIGPDRIPGVAGAGGGAAGPTYVAPRTEAERAVGRLWSDLLGIERIGINDNFLELGGHSLVATQLTSRLRDAFQLDLPLRLVFESPTLGEMAARVEDALLREIEALSEDEVERRLSETGAT